MLLLTAAEMRALDRATIAGGVPGAELMERAGSAVVEAMARRFGSPLALRVLVLCGAGNNGGDGFVAARHLAMRGARVRVGVLAPQSRVQGDAAVHLGRLTAAGVPVEFPADEAALAALVGGAGGWDFALDALLGTGAEGEPRGLIASACTAFNRLREQGTHVIAVDLPTGVGADDGAATAVAVRADLTVTFGEPKRGHFLHPGRGLRGELEVADIGLVPAERAGVRGAELSSGQALGALIPIRDPRAHKGSAGRVLVVGGAQGMAGAAVLAARAAARAGAGYVRVAVPASLHDALLAPLLEAMPVACPETAARTLGPGSLARILEEAARTDSVALGTGLSRDPDAGKLARALLPQLNCPVVLDADGLNAFAPPGGNLAGVLRGADAPRIITPHLGEMARLTGETPAALEAHRIDAAREWAGRWGCVVVLKGAPTVIAAPDGRVRVNPTGNPGMATAGTGDVLTGAIAALLAQKLAAFDAASIAVFAHGLAGDLAAAGIGPIGIVAGDLVDRLPHALARMRVTP